jgi:putative hydrolase of the HAD superfamily
MRVRRKLYGLIGRRLGHVDTWLFDLDNTLYPAECDLFELIEVRMGLYLERLLECDRVEAKRVQKLYFHEYGTTLAGLTARHSIDPHDFLDFVHDVPLDRIEPNAVLKAHIAALPGRKLVYTNGDAPYAQRVLDALGLGDSFEGIFDIVASDLIPKPAEESYAALCKMHEINPQTAFFADDMARNLRPAKAIGMATLWINNGSEQAHNAAAVTGRDHVDHETSCLTEWLGAYHEQEFA